MTTKKTTPSTTTVRFNSTAVYHSASALDRLRRFWVRLKEFKDTSHAVRALEKTCVTVRNRNIGVTLGRLRVAIVMKC